LCALLFLATVGCVETAEPEKNNSTSETRIGIYDSRAVAVAFVGSEVYKATDGKKMADMMTEYKKAETEGNSERVEELKAWGEAQQKLLHKQAFSTAPVDDILTHIKDDILKIEKDAGLTIIVSKWDTKALAKHKQAQQVDVTMLLVEAFTPNGKQKKSAIEIQKSDPVSLEKMEHHKD